MAGCFHWWTISWQTRHLLTDAHAELLCPDAVMLASQTLLLLPVKCIPIKKAFLKPTTSAITIISLNPNLHTRELGSATPADMWQTPQTKAPVLSSPLLFPQSPHGYGPACQGQLHPQPSVRSHREPRSPPTRSRLMLSLSHTQTHINILSPLSFQATHLPLSSVPVSLWHVLKLQHILSHCGMFIAFFAATKITATIMLSGVPVSFYFVSPGSGLCLSDTGADILQTCYCSFQVQWNNREHTRHHFEGKLY